MNNRAISANDRGRPGLERMRREPIPPAFVFAAWAFVILRRLFGFLVGLLCGLLLST